MKTREQLTKELNKINDRIYRHLNAGRIASAEVLRQRWSKLRKELEELAAAERTSQEFAMDYAILFIPLSKRLEKRMNEQKQQKKKGKNVK